MRLVGLSSKEVVGAWLGRLVKGKARGCGRGPRPVAYSHFRAAARRQSPSALKKEIIDDPLVRLASWSIDHVNKGSSSAQYSPCSAAWRGIVCDAQKEHVTSKFGSSNLSGSISLSLALLPALFSLNLSNNFLHGSLPSGLFNLPHSALRHLNLSYNSLESLPDSFANLPALLTLDFGSNNFASEIPPSLGQCKAIEVSTSIDNSYIDGTDDRPLKLHGSLPSSFRCCRTITELVVDGVNLTGEIPPSLGQCTALQMIELSRGEIPPELAALAQLKVLDLSKNQLIGHVPIRALENCTSLQTLRLSNNTLTGRIESLDLSKM
ncbi:hypothetical protein L7F22_001700 [Adiantum nelumboides]|nr:hypothetical protein [Adiantum nelumboides]